MTELWGNGGKLNSRSPSFYDPGEPIVGNDAAHRRSMEMGSLALLKAIHAELIEREKRMRYANHQNS
jgi:hypothetical protein